MRLLLETTSSCVSPFIQAAGIEAIDGNQTSQKIMYDEYLKRRELIVNGLNSIDKISCIMPGGAFYVFLNIKKTGMTSNQFCEFILDDAGVAMLPGTSFGQFGAPPHFGTRNSNFQNIMMGGGNFEFRV